MDEHDPRLHNEAGHSKIAADRRGDPLLLVASGAAPHAFPILTFAEWASFLEEAEFHGLTALAHCFFQPVPDRVPSQIAEALAAGYRDSARRGLLLTAWLSDVVARFDAAGIPVIALKGPSLAQALYPDPALRPSFDLDLLVRRSDLARTLELLAGNGYAPPPHLARFPARILLRLDSEVVLHNQHRAPIDLHWALAPSDYPFPIDPDLLWQSRDRIEVAGRFVAVLTRECQLAYLAAHAAKHGWGRLVWLCDIARLLAAPLDWSGAMALTVESRCTRLVHVALLLAHDSLDARVPADVLAAARADRLAVRAAAQAGARLRRTPPREPSTIERTAFNARLATGPLAKARHWAAIVVTPKDEDLARRRLPDWLLWLYRPLRIQRLVGKYGRRLLGFCGHRLAHNRPFHGPAV